MPARKRTPLGPYLKPQDLRHRQLTHDPTRAPSTLRKIQSFREIRRMAPSHTKPRDASRAAHAGETSAHPEGARGRGKGRQLFLSPGHHVIQRSQGALAHKMDGDGKNLTRRSCAARRHSYLIVARARVYRSAQRGGGLEFTQSQLAGRETHKSREAEPRCSTQDHSESFARNAARRRTQKRALRTALRTAHHTEIPQKPHRTRPYTSPRARNAAERAALRNPQRASQRKAQRRA